jgi:aminoglycoside phosphotransferase family enzyme
MMDTLLEEDRVSAPMIDRLAEKLAELLKFYKSYRAYVRGKVNNFRLDDAYTSKAER